MNATRSDGSSERKYARSIRAGVALISILALTACTPSAAPPVTSSTSRPSTTPSNKSEAGPTPDAFSETPDPEKNPSNSPGEPGADDSKAKILQACTLIDGALANKDITQRMQQEQQASDFGRRAAGTAARVGDI